MILRIFLTLIIVSISFVAFAAEGEFDNLCATSLSLGNHYQTDCSVNMTINGKIYCFGNENSKIKFLKDPEGNLEKAEKFYSESK